MNSTSSMLYAKWIRDTSGPYLLACLLYHTRNTEDVARTVTLI